MRTRLPTTANNRLIAIMRQRRRSEMRKGSLPRRGRGEALKRSAARRHHPVGLDVTVAVNEYEVALPSVG